MTHSRIFKVAIVGCGAVASIHAAYLAAQENTDIVALCDVISARAETFREKYAPLSRVYTDYDTMLSEVRPDAVHICTPHDQHCRMACAAMRAGIAVYLEKPVCMTDGEADTLLACEREYRGRITVSYQNRYLPRNVEAHRLCEAHGGVTGAFCNVVWARDLPYYRDSGWRGTQAHEGGGVMINQACHTLDLCLAFCGKVKSISATVANHHLRGKIEVEDTTEAYLTFESGATAVFYATTAYVRSMPVFLEFVCRDGTVVRLADDRLYVNGTEAIAPPDHTPAYGKVYWGVGHGRLIRHFYSALESGDAMPVTAASAATTLRTLRAFYRSHGEEIIMPDGDNPVIPETV